MALFVDLVALSNGLHGSVQMDSVVLFSWIGWLRHHGILIIQAIMENQDILIFDEPTRGLDDYSIEVFIKKMKDLIEKGKTVIIASHDFVDIGYSRFITMKNGR